MHSLDDPLMTFQEPWWDNRAEAAAGSLVFYEEAEEWDNGSVELGGEDEPGMTYSNFLMRDSVIHQRLGGTSLDPSEIFPINGAGNSSNGDNGVHHIDNDPIGPQPAPGRPADQRSASASCYSSALDQRGSTHGDEYEHEPSVGGGDDQAGARLRRRGGAPKGRAERVQSV